MDGVRLVHPPAPVPPIVTGVVRPRSLELSGRVADGTIIAEGNGPAELAAAAAHIARGREAGDRPGHELLVFAFLRADDDPAESARLTRDAVAGQAGWLGIDPADLFALIGAPGTIAGKVAALRAAGADTVVLRPPRPGPVRPGPHRAGGAAPVQPNPAHSHGSRARDGDNPTHANGSPARRPQPLPAAAARVTATTQPQRQPRASTATPPTSTAAAPVTTPPTPTAAPRP